MSNTKFQIADDLDLDTFGAGVMLADGSVFDIAAAARKGSGTFTSDNDQLTQALDANPAVKRAPARSTKKQES